MIEVELPKLERMAENLRVYDVVDGGWEGDPEGKINPKPASDNIQHVGNHLAGMLAFKDFMSPEAVEVEIAPDFVQYGLRLARWTDVEIEDLVTQGMPHIREAREINGRLNIRYPETLPIVSLIYANGILSGKQMHDEGHDKLHEEAVRQRQEKIKNVGQILINTAHIYSKGLDFDIEKAFYARLSSLRERFGIPKTEA